MKNIFESSLEKESSISPKPKIKERVTTSILYYKFKLNNMNLLLIDTPGISENNSDLSEEDIDFLQNTKKVIKDLRIQTIVFLQKSTEQKLFKSVKSYVDNLNSFILTEKINIKIVLVLTFYLGSIEFNLNELPFIISGMIKLDNGIFNYKDPGKLLKAEKLCKKVDKAIKNLFQYFIAGIN